MFTCRIALCIDFYMHLEMGLTGLCWLAPIRPQKDAKLVPHCLALDLAFAACSRIAERWETVLDRPGNDGPGPDGPNHRNCLHRHRPLLERSGRRRVLPRQDGQGRAGCDGRMVHRAARRDGAHEGVPLCAVQHARSRRPGAEIRPGTDAGAGQGFARRKLGACRQALVAQRHAASGSSLH
jgi:hypothetical protein